MANFSALKLWPLPTTCSPDGIAQLKARESCRLKAYRDTGGTWTIGWGRAYAVYGNEVITQEQADHFLAIDILLAENAVIRSVHQELSQHSCDALCSFIYNIGVAAFERSDVLRDINTGDLPRAAGDFLGWCRVNHKTDAGLLNRRRSEAAQFAF